MSPEPIELSTAESLPQLVAAAPAFTDKISIKSATVSESSTGKENNLALLGIIFEIMTHNF